MENISFETSRIINFINDELEIEVIYVCTDYATNIKKAFNASDQISELVFQITFYLLISDKIENAD